MAYVLAQNPTAATGSGASISKTFASNTTAHSLLVAFVTTDAGTPGTFTYTGGGTWVSIGSIQEPSSTQWISIGYCLDATGGSAPTVQASWTGSGSFNGLMIAEFTNGGLASAFDTSTAGSTGNSNAPTDSAMTAAAADAVVSYVMYAAGSGTPGAGTGFTIPTNGTDTTNGAAWEYQILSGPGSVTAAFTLTASGPWGLISGAFKPAGGTAPPPLPFAPGKTWRRRFKHPQILPTQPPPIVVPTGTPQPIVVTGPTNPPLSAVITVDRATLQDDPVLTTAPPIVLTPQPPPRPAGVVVVQRSSLIDLSTPAPIVVNPQPARPVPGVIDYNRGTFQDDPVLTTKPPVVQVGNTPYPVGGLAYTARSSLVDVATPTATPGPIVVNPQLARPVPGVVTYERGTLQDDPVLTTNPPVVRVGATPLPAGGLAFTSRSSLVDVAPATATPQPIVLVGQTQPPIQVAQAIISLGVGMDDAPPTSGPVTFPIVVTGQTPRPPGVSGVQRATLADPPQLTTPGPIVVTGATPKPLNTPQPYSSRSSLADITAATPQPIIEIGAGGVPVTPTPYLSRSSYADVVVPVGTPSPIVVASQAKQAAASPNIIRRNSLQDDAVLTTKPPIVIAAPYLRIPTATVRVAIPASGIGVPFATTLTGNVHGPDGQILAGLAGTASGAILGDMHGPTSSGEGGTIS